MTIALHASAYTPARARLIVTNGYCRGHGFDAGHGSDAGHGFGHDSRAEIVASPRHSQRHQAEPTVPARRRDVSPVSHAEV
ncbi:hypothetical protein ACGF0J_23495 [Nonomuraea sp. NPDC047897]|uniref:hypothetical protein n=1 Tax=Nonomuraea sp. NPDC047897 TaxID=3364346 RepID=UPI00371AEE66